MKLTHYLPLVVLGLGTLSACSKGDHPTASDPDKKSSTTGVEYNTEKGMSVANFKRPPEIGRAHV